MVNFIIIDSNKCELENLVEKVQKQDLINNNKLILSYKPQILKALDNQVSNIVFLDKEIIEKPKEEFISICKNKLIAIPIKYKTPKKDNKCIQLTKLRNIIIKELETIGYNFKYKGSIYLIDTILEVCNKGSILVKNLKSEIYPIVAKKYNRTSQGIKNCIRVATTNMYCECDMKKLIDYFNFYEDTMPTTKEVIFTVANKVSKQYTSI